MTYLAHIKNPNESNVSSKLRKIKEDIIDINYIDNVQCIYPYYDEESELWVFDDAEKGLHKEALVEGIDDMLDYIIKSNGMQEKRLGIAFSDTEINNYDVLLKLTKEDENGRTNGNIYTWEKENITGWLCPSLYKYFQTTPKNIYIKILKFGVK